MFYSFLILKRIAVLKSICSKLSTRSLLQDTKNCTILIDHTFRMHLPKIHIQFECCTDRSACQTVCGVRCVNVPVYLEQNRECQCVPSAFVSLHFHQMRVMANLAKCHLLMRMHLIDLFYLPVGRIRCCAPARAKFLLHEIKTVSIYFVFNFFFFILVHINVFVSVTDAQLFDET